MVQLTTKGNKKPCMDLLQGYKTITEQENKRMIYKDNEQLVNELKKVMIDTNTKQVDLANIMEVPKQAITKIFNKKNLTCDDMQKLLSLMGYELHIDFVPVDQNEKQTQLYIVSKTMCDDVDNFIL